MNSSAAIGPASSAAAYKGPDYAKNTYDTNPAAAALTLHNNGGPSTENPWSVLRMGDNGKDVKALQAALKINADDFAPAPKPP